MNTSCYKITFFKLQLEHFLLGVFICLKVVVFGVYGFFTPVVKMGVRWDVSKFLNINPDQVTPHLKVLHKKIEAVF